MERRRLNSNEVESGLAGLAGLPGWSMAEDRIELKRKFENFADALQFVNDVGVLAEAADHHPDISFGWGYASVELTTHDRGGVTDVDLALARSIAALD